MQKLKGRYNIGGDICINYKNNARKVNCCIRKDNTQLLVDKYGKQNKHVPNFTFGYKFENGGSTSLLLVNKALNVN